MRHWAVLIGWMVWAGSAQVALGVGSASLALWAGSGSLALWAGSARAAERFAPVYDLYFGGVWAAELSVDAAIGAEDYRAQAALRTKGVVGAVYGATFDVSAEGRVVPSGAWQPARFVADSKSRSKAQWVELRYDGDRPVAVQAVPEFDPKPWELDPLTQAGAPDPLSAALAVLGPRPRAQVCNRSTEIFDGRRRIAIRMARAEPDPGPRELVGPQRPALRCGAIYRRIAGFKPKLMERQRDFPFDLTFRQQRDGQFWLVRASGTTPLGEAVVLLRDR